MYNFSFSQSNNFAVLYTLLVFPVAILSYLLLVHIQSKFLEQSHNHWHFFTCSSKLDG